MSLFDVPLINKQYQLMEEGLWTFQDGTIPSFFSTSTDNGSATATSANGGQVQLSTGTTSTGDSTTIQGGPVSPDRYDAIGIGATFSIENFGDYNVLQANVPQMRNDADDSGVGSFVGPQAAKVFGNDSGMSDATITRGFAPYAKEDTEYKTWNASLLWDHVDGLVHHHIQDTWAVDYSNTLPDPSLDYDLYFQIKTEDTTLDRVLNIQELRVGYFKNL